MKNEMIFFFSIENLEKRRNHFLFLVFPNFPIFSEKSEKNSKK